MNKNRTNQVVGLALVSSISLIFFFGNIMANFIGFTSEAIGYKIFRMILDIDTVLPITSSDYHLYESSVWSICGAWFFTVVILFTPFLVGLHKSLHSTK